MNIIEENAALWKILRGFYFEDEPPWQLSEEEIGSLVAGMTTLGIRADRALMLAQKFSPQTRENIVPIRRNTA